MMFPEHHWMDYPDALKEEIQCILLPQPMPAALVHQVAQLAPVIAQATIQPPTALRLPKVSQPPPTATLLPPTAPMDVQTPQAPCRSAPALDRHNQPFQKPGRYEHSVKCKQHIQEEADYHKSHKTCMMDELRTGQMLPPSTSHSERGKMPSKRTTRPREQRNQQKAPGAAGQTSSQTSATPQPKSKQTRTLHSTGFYEEGYKHGFCRSPPKLTDYINPLQRDPKIQKRLEALKNPPKPVFQVPLPQLPQMDVEPAMSSSTALPPTATLLPPTTPTSAMATTVTHAMLLPPTAPTSVQTTTPAQPSLVITTRLILGAAPQAGTTQSFEPRLPSEATRLSNYTNFQTMDSLHCIRLETPCYLPRIDPSLKAHYHTKSQERQPPVSPDFAALILPWVTGLWAQELSIVDAIHTPHLALFLYKACGLDNSLSLLQAYNTAVGLIDS
uniref:Uncharacterized protein n=1 Tax=Romanomermis culicivorax TaxID=13658 RepID=A0A915JH26_ROMCU